MTRQIIQSQKKAMKKYLNIKKYSITYKIIKLDFLFNLFLTKSNLDITISLIRFVREKSDKKMEKNQKK